MTFLHGVFFGMLVVLVAMIMADVTDRWRRY